MAPPIRWGIAARPGATDIVADRLASPQYTDQEAAKRQRAAPRPALTDEAKADRLDLPRLDQPQLLGGLDGVELLVEVRAPREEQLDEATIELGAHRVVAVDGGVLVAPPAEQLLPVSGCDVMRVVANVPAKGALVHPVIRVVVDHQGAGRPQQPGDPVEAAREVVNVMQRAVGDDRVEGALVGEPLQGARRKIGPSGASGSIATTR